MVLVSPRKVVERGAQGGQPSSHIGCRAAQAEGGPGSAARLLWQTACAWRGLPGVERLVEGHPWANAPARAGWLRDPANWQLVLGLVREVSQHWNWRVTVFADPDMLPTVPIANSVTTKDSQGRDISDSSQATYSMLSISATVWEHAQAWHQQCCHTCFRPAPPPSPCAAAPVICLSPLAVVTLGSLSMIPSRPIDGVVHPLLSLHLRLQFPFLAFAPY